MKIALITALAVLGFPTAAMANWTPYVPPGNSGANQYVESVPSASGNSSSGAVRSHRPTSGKALAAQPGPVSRSTEAALLASGRAGRITAILAATTAPRGLAPAAQQHRRSKNRSGVAAVPATPPGGSAGGSSSGSAGGSSRVGSVLGAMTGASGTSSLLPFVLALSALVVAAFAVGRRRRQPS